MLCGVRGALNREWVRYTSGLLLASACLAVCVWAVITFISGNLAMSDKLGLMGLVVGLLPVAGVAARHSNRRPMWTWSKQPESLPKW
ncbi:hypothetical protein GCM10010347_65150 [Streptomyces cirratus]|uniref:Integral membrane protein n=1 Tax=Streptomyces cirratus TaxID=68187 RepID=A0ABQ3F5F6_9ACTN|nr:hypothetical protein GCM10010347_65150 [Streptomyces cirratus]